MGLAPQRPLRLRCLFFAEPLHAERSAAFRDLCSEAAIPLPANSGHWRVKQMFQIG
jgi:hypothetical protein